jgi:U3 small nucleolar RNA-associated protein 14
MGVLAGSNGGAAVDGKYQKLFEMDFMKEARDRREQRARNDVKDVLRELEEMSDEGSDGEGAGAGADGDGDGQPTMKFNFGKGFSPAGTHKGKTGAASGKALKAAAISGGCGEEEANPWLSGDAAVQSSISKKNLKKGAAAQAQDAIAANDAAAAAAAAAAAGGDGDNAGGDGTGTGKRASKRKGGGGGTNGAANVDHVVIAATATATATATSSSSSSSGKSTRKGGNEPTARALLIDKSQDELVEEAFVGPDLEGEFANLKDAEIDSELGVTSKRAKIMKDVKTGWGDWAGPGGGGMVAAGSRTLDKRKRLLRRVDEDMAAKKANRKDAKKLNVMLSERRLKTSAKLQVGNVPHPFRTWDEYERSMQMPLGEEWNTSRVVRKNTKPEVLKRAGRLIQPAKVVR